MFPLLGEIPLPRAELPAAALLVALSAGLALVSALARRSGDGRRALALLGAAVALLAAAPGARGRTLELGPAPVHAFGTLLALALGWLGALTLRRAVRGGLARDLTAGAVVATLAGGLAGARLVHLLTVPATGRVPAAWLALREGGLSLDGAVVGGLLAGALALRRAPGAFRVFADAAAPPALLALAVGRVGSHLAGADFGRPLPPGAPGWLARLGTFPRWEGEGAPPFEGAPAWLHHVAIGLVDRSLPASLPVHPAALYEGALAALVAALALPRRSAPPAPGALAARVTLAFALLRVVAGRFRGDPDRLLLPGPLPLTLSDLPAVALVVGVGVVAARERSAR